MVEQFFNGLFVILILLSPICLIIGLIKPSIFNPVFRKQLNRKKTSLIFGIAFVVFFILFGMTTTTTPTENNGSNPLNSQQAMKPAVNSAEQIQQDQQYISQIQTNVFVPLQKAEDEMANPTIEMGAQDDSVLTKEQQSQKDFSEAQTNLQSIKVPSDFSQVNDLLNKAVSSQNNGINTVVSAIKNSLANVDDLTFLDLDTVNQGFSNLEQGTSYENQAMSLIEQNSKTISPDVIASIKAEQQGVQTQIQYFQGLEGYIKNNVAVEDSIKKTISQFNGSTTVSYKNMRIEKGDLDEPAGTMDIIVGVETSDFFNKSSLVRDTGNLSSDLFKTIFKSDSKVFSPVVQYYGSTTDRYGNQKDDVIMTYYMDKNTYGKINWQNFDQTGLCDFLNQENTLNGGGFNNGCNILVNIK